MWLTLLSCGHNTKVFDEIKYFKFVKNHIEEMIELVGDDALLTSGRVSLKSVDTIGFMIEGFRDNRTLMALKDLVLMDKDRMDYGNETLSTEAFILWLKTHLEVNPFGLGQCYKNGQKLPWLPKALKKGSTRNACIVSNADVAPLKKKIVSLNRISNQTVAQTSRILHGATVFIQQCNKSFIYLLSPMRSVWIENCHNCTLVLGPVASTCEVLSCTYLRVISVSRRIQIRKCAKCTFYVLTPSEPILLERQNSEISFAPYNTFYPKLEEHMIAAGITKTLSMWESPIALENNHKEEEQRYSIIPPREFSLFIIPFHMEGSTKHSPIDFPTPYKEQVDANSTKYQKWKDLVEAAHFGHEDSKHLQCRLRQRFWEWCARNDNCSELLTLEAYLKHHNLQSK